MPSSAVPSSPDVFVSLDAASPAGSASSPRCSTTPARRSSSTTTPATPASATSAWSTARAPATVTLVAGLLDELGVTLDAAPGHLPLRRAGRRHRLLPVRQHPARHPRARRPAAGAPASTTPTISRRLFDTAPFGWLGLLSAVTGRAVLEPEVGARPGVDLVEHRRGRRARPARRAARGAGRRRPLDAGGRRRLRAQGAGRRLVVGVAALARRHRPRPGRHGARRRRAHAGRRLQLLPRPREDDRGPARSSTVGLRHA